MIPSRFSSWKGVRAVDGLGFENRRSCETTGGSNPPLSEKSAGHKTFSFVKNSCFENLFSFLFFAIQYLKERRQNPLDKNQEDSVLKLLANFFNFVILFQKFLFHSSTTTNEICGTKFEKFWVNSIFWKKQQIKKIS